MIKIRSSSCSNKISHSVGRPTLSPEQLVLSTDCGMKPLARMVAKMKLHSLAEGAALVRKEVAGV